MDTQNRRKLGRLLINPRYQLKYILMMSFVGVLLTLINSMVFYYFTKENYAILVELSPMTDEAKLQLYAELHQIIVYMGGFTVLFLGGVGLLGAVISHRTAGPLYHFKKVFDEIKAGNVAQRVKLRPRDDFQEVAHSFNEMMDSITKK